MPKSVKTIKTTITTETPRLEFSQKIVVLSWAVTIVWITLSFILAFMDKSTNSEVTVALVTESFGVTLAYFIYQSILKTSRNKHGIDCDGIPFKVKQKLEDIVEPPTPTEEDPEDVGL